MRLLTVQVASRLEYTVSSRTNEQICTNQQKVCITNSAILESAGRKSFRTSQNGGILGGKSILTCKKLKSAVKKTLTTVQPCGHQCLFNDNTFSPFSWLIVPLNLQGDRFYRFTHNHIKHFSTR
jgi:hypothetical protein